MTEVKREKDIPEENPDPLEAHLSDGAEEPEDENLNNEDIPDGAESEDGQKKVLVPVVTSMTKYLFKNYRLAMYSYINRCLKNGSLSRITGVHVRNRIFNRETLSFPGVTFWRIDREDFYADVNVELILETDLGKVRWNGILVFWCSFEGDFACEAMDLIKDVSRRDDGFTLLSPYLVPYHTSKEMDCVADRLWKYYGMVNALKDPEARKAKELAGAMGLSIEYHPVYEHRGVDSIIFFTDDYLEIGEDRVEKEGSGKKKHIKAPEGKRTFIKANTIVVNTNRIKQDYSSFNIYHECIHYAEHYLFFRLQQMGSNDPRKYEMEEVTVREGQEIKDPVYFMEKQANRGAYGLMMPHDDTRERILRALSQVKEYKNRGDKYEKAGIEVARDLGMPHFRMRARMIQIGFLEAKGALNYVERRLIAPFSFDIEAWKEEQHTFVVDEPAVKNICDKNDDLRKLIEGGSYVYADGHVVRKSDRFVKLEDGRWILTDEALSRVDDCCLRFTRVYVQNYIGRYVFGRMYYDADYVKQTMFYLEDLINQRNLDEIDAKDVFREEFPKDFKEAVEFLKKKNHMSNEKMAEYFVMDDSTFARRLKDPKFYHNGDFLTMLCLCFRTPDWVSRLLFKRAKYQFDEEDRRDAALQEILRAYSEDGLEAANDYLKRHGLDPLSV